MPRLNYHFENAKGPFDSYRVEKNWLLKNLHYTEDEWKLFELRVGDCYDLSFEVTLSSVERFELVHGYHEKDEHKIGHAWLENGTEVVDVVFNRRFDKTEYYQLFNATEIVRARPDQFEIPMLVYETKGPWHRETVDHLWSN